MRIAAHNHKTDKPLVAVLPCTAADVIFPFSPHNAPAYKVDIVNALELPPSSAAVDGFRTRRALMPGSNINHTDYEPLLHRPTAILVETKRTNDYFEKARVQLIMWLAGQWTKYESMSP